jgi:hypothetical protein
MTPFNFVCIAFIILLLYIWFNPKQHHIEGLDAMIVENAFTDTKCIQDDLPLIRFYKDPNSTINALHTFRCLTSDGTNCIDRTTVGVPSNYACSNAKKNVNYYLSVDGIRNVRVNPNLPISKVYNDFENLRLLDTTNPKLNKNMAYLTCTADGLKDNSHWCGKVWNKINAQCNDPIGKFGEYQDICKNVPSFVQTPSKGYNVDITNYSQIAQFQKNAVAASQAKRIRGR